MSATIKFDQRAFKKGVDDTLTLAPLRRVIVQIVEDKRSTKRPSSKDAEVVVVHTPQHGRHARTDRKP